MNISDLNKAQVLAALYNNARTQGLGIFQFNPAPMGEEEAAELLKDGDYFDYLKGRVMKIRIEDHLDTNLYNRDNGSGAAEAAIEELRRGAKS